MLQFLHNGSFFFASKLQEVTENHTLILGTHVQKSSLPRLLDILSPVVHNWSSFAKLIGVPFSQISSIEAANPRPSLYNCFSQSLEWWVANHDDPTYEAILAVLDPKRGETTPLMNRDLAKEVKEFMANKQGEPLCKSMVYTQVASLVSTAHANKQHAVNVYLGQEHIKG